MNFFGSHYSYGFCPTGSCSQCAQIMCPRIMQQQCAQHQVCNSMPPLQGWPPPPPPRTTNQPTNPHPPHPPARPPWSCAWSCARPARARPLARARLDLVDRAGLNGADGGFGGAAVDDDDEQSQLSCTVGRKATCRQFKRKTRARRRSRCEGAVRSARLTGLIRRIELVRVAQLALVLEVVDSARARQVGGHVDALATPEAVGRGQSMVRNAALARQTRRQRAGSGRQRAGRAGAPVMAAGPFLQLRSVM